MPQQGQMSFMPGQQPMGFMPGQQQMALAHGQPIMVTPQQQMQMMQMFQQQQLYMLQHQMQLQQQNVGWQQGQQMGQQQEGDNRDGEQGLQGGQSALNAATPSFVPGSQGQGEIFGGDDRRLRGVPLRQSDGSLDSGFPQQQMFMMMNQDPRQQQYGFQGGNMQQQFSKPNMKGMPFQQGPTIDTGPNGRGSIQNMGKGGKFQQSGSFDDQDNAMNMPMHPMQGHNSNNLIMNIPQHPMGSSTGVTNGQQLNVAPQMEGHLGGKGWKDKGMGKNFNQSDGGNKNKGKGGYAGGFIYNNSKGTKGNKKGQFNDFQGGKGRGKPGKGRGGGGGGFDRKVDDDAWAAIGRLRQDHADGNGVSGNGAGSPDAGVSPDAGAGSPDVGAGSPEAGGDDVDAS
eukprot:GEMP01023175.1.p1 GENE.GEMP01023175.1~~GEMP01023175.1.p1  ORF type:complete len:396 (+),score=116.91 GEMP01023175.1:3-1190(+)